jgi:hypothetical protein
VCESKVRVGILQVATICSMLYDAFIILGHTMPNYCTVRFFV